MTETELTQAIAAERLAGLEHVDRVMLAWRRDLWPNATNDPISRANRLARMRRELDADAYWFGGPRGRILYGGICAG